MTSGGDVYMNVNGPQNNAGPLALAAAFSFVDRASSTEAKMVRNGAVVLTDTTVSTGSQRSLSNWEHQQVIFPTVGSGIGRAENQWNSLANQRLITQLFRH
jgi:hypothetical protein